MNLKNGVNTAGKVFSAFLMLLIVGCFARPAYAAAGQDTYQQIGEYLQRAIEEAHIPGMAISIVDKDNVLFSNTYGNCKSVDTPFLIGSTTKSFTALAVMQLAEQEKIDLDAHISEYLSGVSVGDRVTVRQLLNQTSGFVTYQTRQNLTVTGSFGKHVYANVNYALLGEIISSVSGISYEDYVEENIYKPIGMNHSYTTLADAKTGGLIDGYRNFFGFSVPMDVAFPDGQGWSSVASGYLASSVSDMGKYLQMYLNNGNGLVSPDSISTLFYDNVYDEPSDTHYGMGWVLHNSFAEPILMHGGNVENYIANMFILPESGIGVVMLINTNDYLVANGMMGTDALNIISGLTGPLPVETNGTNYFAAHLLIDIIYLAIFLISLIPIFLIKRMNPKRKIRTLVAGGVLHILYPTFLLCVPLLIGTPFFVIHGYVPDLFWVLVLSAALAYAGGIIKIISLFGKHKVRDTPSVPFWAIL